jgi:hypothetical protein
MLVQVVASVVVAVFAAGIWLTGGKVDIGWLRFFSAAVLVATGILWLWESSLWRLAIVQRTRAVPRNINGTWKGTLESFWQGSPGHPGAPKMPTSSFASRRRPCLSFS